MTKFSEHDQALIRKARSLHWTQQGEIDRLIDLAESEEAKSEINSIGTALYHEEEYHAGCL